MSFQYVSLFSGVGGFEQALNSMGGECMMASEYDPKANTQFNQVAYEVLYGHKPMGDVTDIPVVDVPAHDLLVGGPPCQTFSMAGRRQGFADTRGTLFFEVARIASAKQPKVILLENVKGLVGHDKGRTLDTIVHTLNDIGYHVDFNVLTSKFFGVPQNRERIFIVAVRDDLARPAPWITKGNRIAQRGKKRIEGYEGIKTFNFNWPEETEVSARLKDVLESDVDDKYYLAEEKAAAFIGKLMAGEIEETESDTVEMIGHVDLNGHDICKRVYSRNAMSPTLPTGGSGNTTPKIPELVGGKWRVRKLTPIECWRLQGFPDEAHDAVQAVGISNAQRYKQAGNAVTVPVIRAIAERLLPYLDGSSRGDAEELEILGQTTIFDFI